VASDAAVLVPRPLSNPWHNISLAGYR
jgi:hypothetical protein